MAPASFSASSFLPDIRRYGATYMNWCVGKPLAYILATPEQSDDADNPLRVAFGNEAADRDIEALRAAVRLTVWDGFGSHRDRRDHHPAREHTAGIVDRPGLPGGGHLQVPETGHRMRGGALRRHRRIDQRRSRDGELVNTTGSGLFRGYYNDSAATGERLRGGIYWSADLADRDEQGWIYLAGRTSDWMPVDGENLDRRAHRANPAATARGSPWSRSIRPRRARGRPGDGGDGATGRRETHPRGLRGVPRRPARPVAEGAAPLRLDRRGTASSTATNKILKRELIALGTAPRGPLPVGAVRFGTTCPVS